MFLMMCLCVSNLHNTYIFRYDEQNHQAEAQRRIQADVMQVLKQYLKWNINILDAAFLVWHEVLEVLKMSLLQIALVSAHSNHAPWGWCLEIVQEWTKITVKLPEPSWVDECCLTLVILLKLSIWDKTRPWTPSDAPDQQWGLGTLLHSNDTINGHCACQESTANTITLCLPALTSDTEPPACCDTNWEFLCQAKHSSFNF